MVNEQEGIGGLYQRRGTHDKAATTYRVLSSALSEESPQKSDGLQRLAQAHVIGKNTAVALKVPKTHHTTKHELHTLALVLSQMLAQHAVDAYAPPSLAAVRVFFFPQYLQHV
jgi:hypothetical protein